MGNDSGGPPLPRRVPGASDSPKPKIRIDRSPIPDDLRELVLTAIAGELERDRAAALRGAAAQDNVAAPYGLLAPGDGAALNGVETRVPGPAQPEAEVAAPEAGVAELGTGVAEPEAGVAREGAEAPGKAVPLPRRAPGANGGRRPPPQVRRDFLPPSLLGRRLDADDLTQPIPKLPGPAGTTAPAGDDALATGSPGATAASAPTVPTGRPGPSAPAPADLTGPSAPTMPAGRPGPSAPAPADLTGPAAPTMPAGRPGPSALTEPATYTGPSAPTEPAGPSATAVPAAPPAAEPAREPAPPDRAPAPGSPAPPPPSPAPGQREPHAAKGPRRPGRRYRVIGVIISVIVLAVAGALVLVLSGRASPEGNRARAAGQDGLAARNLAAVWVSSQVSHTAVVACDPVMCRALQAHGFPASGLYRLGLDTTNPGRSEIIVATQTVRAHFGSLLSTVYAPVVMASFGAGAQRVDIRQTAQHGAAAYQALLNADVASRKASGTELLHSNRIAVTPAARRELAAGQVDSRLLIALAGLAGVHPIAIVDFGRPDPGADPRMPLRTADLAETGHPGSRQAAYVRSLVLFLHAQHNQFRPASVTTVRLPGGQAVLRIQVTAPSPLGLFAPHRD